MYFSVYNILINNEIVYVGRTNNIVRRQREHRSRYKLYLKDNKKYHKELYKYLSDNNIKPTDIILTPIYETKKLVESKRFEMFTILKMWFSSNNFTLKQRIPPIHR